MQCVGAVQRCSAEVQCSGAVQRCSASACARMLIPQCFGALLPSTLCVLPMASHTSHALHTTQHRAVAGDTCPVAMANSHYLPLGLVEALLRYFKGKWSGASPANDLEVLLSRSDYRGCRLGLLDLVSSE